MNCRSILWQKDEVEKEEKTMTFFFPSYFKVMKTITKHTRIMPTKKQQQQQQKKILVLFRCALSYVVRFTYQHTTRDLHVLDEVSKAQRCARARCDRVVVEHLCNKQQKFAFIITHGIHLRSLNDKVQCATNQTFFVTTSIKNCFLFCFCGWQWYTHTHGLMKNFGKLIK